MDPTFIPSSWMTTEGSRTGLIDFFGDALGETAEQARLMFERRMGESK